MTASALLCLSILAMMLVAAVWAVRVAVRECAK